MAEQPEVFRGRPGTVGADDYIGYYELDRHGRLRPRADVRGMLAPVRCYHCGAVYDSADVEVTARYADCSRWKAPCCGRMVDDRTWKSLPDIINLDQNGRPR